MKALDWRRHGILFVPFCEIIVRPRRTSARVVHQLLHQSMIAMCSLFGTRMFGRFCEQKASPENHQLANNAACKVFATNLQSSIPSRFMT